MKWRFNTIPQPGELGHETWEDGSKHTGASNVWTVAGADEASPSALPRACLEQIEVTLAEVGRPPAAARSPFRANSNSSERSVENLFPPRSRHAWAALPAPELARIVVGVEPLPKLFVRSGVVERVSRRQNGRFGVSIALLEAGAQRLPFLELVAFSLAILQVFRRCASLSSGSSRHLSPSEDARSGRREASRPVVTWVSPRRSKALDARMTSVAAKHVDGTDAGGPQRGGEGRAGGNCSWGGRHASGVERHARSRRLVRSAIRGLAGVASLWDGDRRGDCPGSSAGGSDSRYRGATRGWSSCSERPKPLGVASAMGSRQAWGRTRSRMMWGTAFRPLLRMRPQIMGVGLPAWGRRWRQPAQVFTGCSAAVESARGAGVREGVLGADFRLSETMGQCPAPDMFWKWSAK